MNFVFLLFQNEIIEIDPVSCSLRKLSSEQLKMTVTKDILETDHDFLCMIVCCCIPNLHFCFLLFQSFLQVSVHPSSSSSASSRIVRTAKSQSSNVTSSSTISSKPSTNETSTSSSSSLPSSTFTLSRTSKQQQIKDSMTLPYWHQGQQEKKQTIQSDNINLTNQSQSTLNNEDESIEEFDFEEEIESQEENDSEDPDDDLVT